jgi:hypothetical protein
MIRSLLSEHAEQVVKFPPARLGAEPMAPAARWMLCHGTYPGAAPARIRDGTRKDRASVTS